MLFQKVGYKVYVSKHVNEKGKDNKLGACFFRKLVIRFTESKYANKKGIIQVTTQNEEAL